MFTGPRQRVVAVTDVSSLEVLKTFLLRFSLFNLVVIAGLGLYMRAYPLLPHAIGNYSYLVHTHSHFAFGGWAMPVLMWLFMQFFPEVVEQGRYKHWRLLILLTCVAAYGMLFSFPFQGYGPVSILFSTLSVVRDYYLAILVWKHTRNDKKTLSVKFIRTGLIFLVMSAAGPLATGPLKAAGMSASPLYSDVVYFYLHFQYNGWFLFCILGLFYRWLEQLQLPLKNGERVYRLLSYACIPAYVLSVLWSHPGLLFNCIAAIAAVMQVMALPYFIGDVNALIRKGAGFSFLLKLASSAFIMKMILQAVSAHPFFADLAYHNRNFIIAYLHLVLLGVISLFALTFAGEVLGQQKNRLYQAGLWVFITAFVSTEILLVINTTAWWSGMPVGGIYKALVLFTALFPLGALILCFSLFKETVSSPSFSDSAPNAYPSF